MYFFVAFLNHAIIVRLLGNSLHSKISHVYPYPSICEISNNIGYVLSCLQYVYVATLAISMAVFILGYQYWETTSKFRGWSVCTEGMIYHMSQDFRRESVNLGEISSPNSSEINTDQWTYILPSDIWTTIMYIYAA